MSSMAIFDSGVGGLSISRLLPQEALIYLADNKNLPYGDLEARQIVELVEEAVAFLAGLGARMVVLGCHTASACARGKSFPIPVIDMVQGTCHLLRGKKLRRLAVLGTSRTIASNLYQWQLALEHPSWEIIPIACPLLAPLIEEGKDSERAVRESLFPLQEEPVDGVLLACTHYSWIVPTIQKVLGDTVKIFDPADQIAGEVLRFAQEKKGGSHTFYVTKDPERFDVVASSLLEKKISSSLVEINSRARLG